MKTKQYFITSFIILFSFLLVGGLVFNCGSKIISAFEGDESWSHYKEYTNLTGNISYMLINKTVNDNSGFKGSFLALIFVIA